MLTASTFRWIRQVDENERSFDEEHFYRLRAEKGKVGIGNNNRSLLIFAGAL